MRPGVHRLTAPVVTVVLPAALSGLAGSSRVEVTGRVGTVAEVLDVLRETVPAVERRIRDEAGALRVYVNVYVDGEDVRRREGLQTPVAAGAEVMVIPSVAGG